MMTGDTKTTTSPEEGFWTRFKRDVRLDLLKRIVILRGDKKRLKKQLKQMQRSRNFYYTALMSIAERRTNDPVGHARSHLEHGSKSKS